MPEGLQRVPELSPGAYARTSPRDCWTALYPVASDPLIRVEREIRDLEREIAFLDVLCRSYERCLPTSSDG
jgi:hypothetical protein